MSHLDFFRQALAKSHPTWQVVDAAGDLAYIYLAVQIPEGIMPMIYEVWWEKYYYNNFYYRELSEWMSPRPRCPEKILRLLDDPFVLYKKQKEIDEAERWRRDCRAYHNERRSRPKVRQGNFIVFDRPILFTDGTKHQALEWISGSTFRVKDKKYTISKWRTKHIWHVADDVV